MKIKLRFVNGWKKPRGCFSPVKRLFDLFHVSVCQIKPGQYIPNITGIFEIAAFNFLFQILWVGK